MAIVLCLLSEHMVLFPGNSAIMLSACILVSEWLNFMRLFDHQLKVALVLQNGRSLHPLHFLKSCLLY